MKKRRYNIRYKLKAYLIFIVKLGLVFGLIYSVHWGYIYLFQTQAVDCVQDNQKCSDLVQDLTKQAVGTNLIFTNYQDLVESIKQLSPRIYQVQVEKTLPASVKFEIATVGELARIRQGTESAELVVLDNFVVDNSANDSDLPLVEVGLPVLLLPEQEIEDVYLLNSLKLISELEDHYVSFDRFKVATDSARISLDSGVEVLFDPLQDQSRQIIRLQLIMNQGLAEEAEYIDLRFDRPVIRPN